ILFLMDTQALTDIVIIQACLAKAGYRNRVTILNKAKQLFSDNHYTLMWINHQLTISGHGLLS
ncbi:MAG: hypothetical protein ACXADB_03130, partial [Candidatus Hermodarchaeia archaeon]